MKNQIVILCIIALATMGSSSKVHNRRQVKMDMLRFINSKNYTYSDIPDTVIKLINEHGSGNCLTGPGIDSGAIELLHDQECILHCVLVNDSNCLFCQTLQTCFGEHTYIYYVRCKNKVELAYYGHRGPQQWGIPALKKFISKKNKPDEVWISPN